MLGTVAATPRPGPTRCCSNGKTLCILPPNTARSLRPCASYRVSLRIAPPEVTGPRVSFGANGLAVSRLCRHVSSVPVNCSMRRWASSGARRSLITSGKFGVTSRSVFRTCSLVRSVSRSISAAPATSGSNGKVASSDGTRGGTVRGARGVEPLADMAHPTPNNPPMIASSITIGPIFYFF